MYTSGWPKIQNRFWYISGSPPAAALKKFVWKLRSMKTMISAAVTGGIANSVRNAITRIIHTNTGMRIIVMPGARMLRMVTRKLTAVATEPMPSMMRPTVQKSVPAAREVAVGERRARERRVAEPTTVGRAAERERRVEEEPAEREDPEAEHVEARERDVARADHQRDEVVAERGRDRHPEQEHHRGAVHREELVVTRRAEDRAVRLRELQPDEQRLDAADAEEEERERGVHDRDLLVVDRGDPAELPGRLARPLEDPHAVAPARGRPRGRLRQLSFAYTLRGVGLGFVAVFVSRKQAIFCASAWRHARGAEVGHVL